MAQTENKKTRYYLVPESMVEPILTEARKSASYMMIHGTGMDRHRGEIAATIDILSRITRCETIEK